MKSRWTRRTRRARRIGRLTWIAIAAAAVVVLWDPALAFSWAVSTGGTDPCHERFTGRAYEAAGLHIPAQAIRLPSDDTWRSLAHALIREMGIDPDAVGEVKSFLLVSLVAGARAPDTDGHSLFNMESLRKVHADPGAKGQYGHSLRGPDDDYARGDAAAVAGVRQMVLELMRDTQRSLSSPHEEQLVETTVYLDFYGLVDLKVWAPMFNVGFAAHGIQDSFSHAIRTEQSGFHRIAHVMNYIDAISSEFDEERDGLAHSETFDECGEPDLAPIVQAADQATAAFFSAVNLQMTEGGSDAVQSFLDEWITLEPGCTGANDYCDNGQWIETARKDQTGPYMEKLMGCAAAGPSPSPSLPTAGLLLAMAVILLARYLMNLKRRGQPREPTSCRLIDMPSPLAGPAGSRADRSSSSAPSRSSR